VAFAGDWMLTFIAIAQGGNSIAGLQAVDSDDDEPIGLVPLIRLLHENKLMGALGAPRGEELDQDRMALQGRQRQLPAVEGCCSEVRRRLAARQASSCDSWRWQL